MKKQKGVEVAGATGPQGREALRGVLRFAKGLLSTGAAFTASSSVTSAVARAPAKARGLAAMVVLGVAALVPLLEAEAFETDFSKANDLMVVVDWTSIAEDVEDSMSDIAAIMNSALKAANEYFEAISQGSANVKNALGPYMREGTRETEIRLWHEIQKAVFETANSAGKLADLEANILDRADLGKERAQEHAGEMLSNADAAWNEAHGYQEKQDLIAEAIIEADLHIDEQDALSSEARRDLSKLIQSFELFESLIEISRHEAQRLEDFAEPLGHVEEAFDRVKGHVGDLCGRARDMRSVMTRLGNSGAVIMGAAEISRAYEKVRDLALKLNDSIALFESSQRDAQNIIRTGTDFPRGPKVFATALAENQSDEQLIQKLRQYASRARDRSQQSAKQVAGQ